MTKATPEPENTTVSTDRLKQIRRAVAKLPHLSGSISPDKLMLLDEMIPPRGTYPTSFSMNHVYAHTKQGESCGTTACVAGLTAHEFPEEMTAALAGSNTANSLNSPASAMVAIKGARIVLGLDHPTAHALFYASGSKWSGGNAALEESPKAAVLRAIDRVLEGERGEAIWAPQDR